MIAFTTKLAELFVQFVARDQEIVQAATDAVKGSLDAAKASADAVGKVSAEAFNKAGDAAQTSASIITRAAAGMSAAVAPVAAALGRIREGATAAGAAAQAAFGRAALTISGFVTAGIAASNAGQIFAFHMERIARAVAGLFGPEIRKVTELIASLAAKLETLSDAQRTSIAHWLGAGAAALAVAVVLPKVVGGIELVIGGVKALTAAFAASGWGAILVAVGAVSAAVLGLGAAGEVAQGGLGQLFQAIKPMVDVAKKLFAGFLEIMKPVLAVAAQVFEGLGRAVQGIMPQLVAAFAVVGQAVQNVIAAVAPLLPQLVAAFSAMLRALAPIIPIMAQLAGTVIEALVPGMQALAGIAVGIAQIVEKLAPAFIRMAQVIAAVVIPVVKALLVPLQALAWALGLITGMNFDAKMPEFKTPKAETGRGPEPKRTGGFEGPEAMWERLAKASSMLTGGKPPEEQQVDLLKEISGKLGQTTEAVKGVKMPFTDGRPGH